MLKHWHHAPLHIFETNALYIVTASTLDKQHHFKGTDRLQHLNDTLLTTLERYGWKTQAWAVFVNHYHFIAQAPDDATTLTGVMRDVHSDTAKHVNRLDRTPGRQVWFQYWDTCLTYERSYYARLNYVHNNPAEVSHRRRSFLNHRLH